MSEPLFANEAHGIGCECDGCNARYEVSYERLVDGEREPDWRTFETLEDAQRFADNHDTGGEVYVDGKFMERRYQSQE